MTFRLFGLPEEIRLAIEQAGGDRTEEARVVMEAAVNSAVEQVERTVTQSMREVQEVIGPHGSITRLQSGGIRITRGDGFGVFLDGVQKTNIQPNGTVVIGSDISDPTTTTEIFFVEDTIYNGEEFGAGDFLIGDNSSGSGNVKYDASEGQLQFRSGTTIGAYMDTDGSIRAGGGDVSIDGDGVWIENQQAGFGFEDTNGDRFNIYLLSDGTDNLVLKNQVGNIRMEIDLTDGSVVNAHWQEDSANANVSQFDIGEGTAGGKLSIGDAVIVWAGKDGQETVFNDDSFDINFRIESATHIRAFFIEAGDEYAAFFGNSGGALAIFDNGTDKRLEIGADHYFPTRNSSNPNGFWNEANEDMDFTFEGDNAAIVFKSDAGLDQAQLGAQVARTGVISPAQITANQNNYNPTGLSTASVLRLTSDAARSITGIAGGSTGRELTLYNIGSFNLTLENEDTNSTAGNRFSISEGDVTLKTGYSLSLWYDGTSSRWRLMGDNPPRANQVPITDTDNNFAATTVEGALEELAENDTPGWVLLEDQTLESANGNVLLYSGGPVLPTGYKHLHVRIVVRTDRVATSDPVTIEINDDTGNNYSAFTMWHNFDSASNDQSQASGGPPQIAFATGASAPSNEFAVYDIFIYDYNATDKNKTIQVRGAQRIGTTTSTMFIYDTMASWHPATPAEITKIELAPVNGDFITGSRFTLWGLK